MAISLSIIVPAADQPDVIRPRYNFGGRRFQRIIDFHVRDLNKMVAQLRERGITVELDSEVYPNGRFARLTDPEGNPIQLWQPGGKDPG